MEEFTPACAERRGQAEAFGRRSTAYAQAKIESAAPSYLRNIIVIVSEMQYRQQYLAMWEGQVDLVTETLHIGDPKTTADTGDMPITAARESGGQIEGRAAGIFADAAADRCRGI
jgi:hypothetical protein